MPKLDPAAWPEHIAINFDAWRAEYAESTFADQAAFYSEVWENYPAQKCWAWSPFYDAIRHLDIDGLRVVELGGWDGSLATLALDTFPEIGSWTNLEICREATERPYCTDIRYHPVALHAHVWEDLSQVPAADLAVATHTFEHLSLEHVLAAVEALNPERALYVEIPILDEPTEWATYVGSHILEVGWRGFEEGIGSLGWQREMFGLASADDTFRLYLRDA